MRYLLPLMVLLAACKGDEEGDNNDNSENAGNAENADNAENAEDSAKPGGVVGFQAKYIGDALPEGASLVVVLSTDGTKQPWEAAVVTKLVKNPTFPVSDSIPGVDPGTYYIGAFIDMDKGGEAGPEVGDPIATGKDASGPLAFEVIEGELAKAPPLDLKVPGGGT